MKEKLSLRKGKKRRKEHSKFDKEGVQRYTLSLLLFICITVNGHFFFHFLYFCVKELFPA